MFPALISWTYHRDEPEFNNFHGIATSVYFSEEDIKISELISSECDKYMIYIVIIFQNPTHINVLSCIKTDENIEDSDCIPKGCFYAYYVVPSRYKVITNSLRITDKENSELYIELNCYNILNDQVINILSLPKPTILFKN